jgi:DNA-binding transcriptional MerR regulator
MRERERVSDEKWLTVSGLAERFGIPQPTIRRYIERHGHHLHTKKHHKSYLISEESIPVLVRIREGYSDGMNSDQVETLLAASGAPTIITVSDVSDQSGERMSVSLEAVIAGFKRQEEFNRLLLESLQRERVENQRQREEDREKIDRLTELMIQQKEAAAAIALPDPAQQRHERLNERFTERRIERQLRAEALDLWAVKPEAERLRKVGMFRKEEDAAARDRFIRDYVDEHFEQRIKGEYDL